MGTNLEGTMYGDSKRGYKVRRLIYWVQYMGNDLEGTMYGFSYRGYNVRRFI